jgi:hypothetical protein
MAQLNANLLNRIATPVDNYNNMVQGEQAVEMNTLNMENQRKEAERAEASAKIDKIASTLFTAKDPKDYAMRVEYLKSQGIEFDPGEDAWENREALQSQAMSLKEHIAQGKDARDFAFDQTKFAADQDYRGQTLGIQRENLSLEREKMAQPDKPPASVAEYEYAKQNGFTGSFIDFEQAKKGEGITMTNPDGTTVTIGGKGGKTTDTMRRAKGFKASMKSSIESLQSNFTALTDPKNYLGDRTKNFGGRAMMTPEGQMAADNFDEVVADALYIASGATLTAPEVERKKAAIIPTPNDSPETIKAKKRRLDDLVNAVDVMAGDAPGVSQTDDGAGVEVYDAQGNRLK